VTLSGSWVSREPTVARVGAVDAVLLDLRTAIANGDIPVGSKLPAESALATKYAVSRSVIREALRSMTALGLTQTRTGRGTFVARSEPEHDGVFGKFSAAALREARPLIEIPAAGLAALRRTEDQLTQLRALVDQMDHDTEPHVWVRLDSLFHVGLAEASGNPVLAAFVTSIRDALAAQSEMINMRSAGVASSRVEHRAILDAIAGQSPADARAAMTAHLQTVEQTVVTLFQ
jgi:GntR family transcriptional repressor for pyruvate dehydrogenase complex